MADKYEIGKVAGPVDPEADTAVIYHVGQLIKYAAEKGDTTLAADFNIEIYPANESLPIQL